MRIDNSVFKYIEHELYNYEQTKKELELYRENIIEGNVRPEVSVSGGRTGDATANKAIKLSSSAFVLKGERTVRAVDDSLTLLGDRYVKLFNLKYVNSLTSREVELELNISKRTFYRMRRQLICTVGQKLGLINAN